MSIKVITHGEKKFQATCPVCGCVFEYELEDIKRDEDSLGKHYYVKCPDCEEMIVKLKYCHGPYSNGGLLDNVILTTREEDGRITFTQPKQPKQVDPCETCPNKDGPRDALGRPIVGDSPCQWCRHYKWKVTW